MDTPRQVTTCPYCHLPVPGLLSGCRTCTPAELDDDQALDQRIEATS